MEYGLVACAISADFFAWCCRAERARLRQRMTTWSPKGLELFGHDLTVALVAGCTCASVHIVAACLFAFVLPDGWWRKQPGFLAHRVVAIPLMVVLSWVGTPAFLRNLSRYDETTQWERVHWADDAGFLIAQIVLGSQVLWDIPATLLVPSLYSRLMLVHHVVLASLTPFIFLPYVSYYVPYYGGVMEISSIPLTVYTTFRPSHYGELTKRFAWVALLDRVPASCARTDAAATPPVSTQSETLSHLRITAGVAYLCSQVMGVLFALLFLVVREVGFPVVTLVYLLQGWRHSRA